MRYAKTVIVGTLALAATLGLAAAQVRGDQNQGSIPERLAYFKLLGLYMAPLDAMSSGASGYNAVVAENAAMNLAMLAQLDQSQLWPSGGAAAITRASLTVSGTVPAARSLDDMAQAIVALAPVAATGLEPMQLALAKVGGSCRACHADYPKSP